MKKFLKRLWESEKGFTLIELIIVIAILAVISAIAVPNISNSVNNARKTTDVTNARTIANAAAMVIAKNPDIESDKTYKIDENGVGGATATEIKDYKFEDYLSVELNGSGIAPQYTGGDAEGADEFVLEIDDEGVITIEVKVGDDPDDNLKIYPKPDDVYINE